MKLKPILAALLFTLAIVAFVEATPPPKINLQGVLRADTGGLEDGNFSMTFRLYDTPAGGLALATQTKTVSVTDGLFHTTLDSMGNVELYRDPNSSSRWVGISVGADPEISPRMELTSMPYALTSASVVGDIVTSPQKVTITGINDVDLVNETFMRSSSTGNEIVMLDSNKTNHSSVRSSWTTSNPGIGTVSGGALTMEVDDDGDGVAEAGFGFKTRQVGNDPWHGTITASAGEGTRVFDVTADPVDVTLEMRAKPQNLGENENWLFGDATISGASHLVAADLDQDGLEDLVVSSKVGVQSNLTVQAGELELGSSSSLFTVTGQPTPVGPIDPPPFMKSRMSFDNDGDGIHNRWIEDLANATEASRLVASDLTGDGIPDVSILDKTTPTGASTIWTQIEGPFASTIRLTAQPAAATTVHISSSDATTGKSGTLNVSASPGGSASAMSHDANNDGTPEHTIDQDCDEIDASLRIKRVDPVVGTVEGLQELSTSSSGVSHTMTWDSDADGVADRRFTGDCDDDDAGLEISAGVAIPKFINVTARDASSLPGSTSDVSLVMGQGPDTGIDLRVRPAVSDLKVYNQQRQVSITTDSSGGRVAIDTIPTTHKLSIGGGGAFCDGTTWTNASDKNAKENFSDVDGAEILEKIEDLSITQWNYKSEDESITHIGPTAQDFKKAFGVGVDDKSISTIDPSGIALAAIKELNKQNQELAKQNKELQKELENLKKKVDDLASRR